MGESSRCGLGKGDELFYRGPADLMSATIVQTPELGVARRDALFADLFSRNADRHANYDVFPGDNEFVMVEGATFSPRVIAIVNWTEEVRRRTEDAVPNRQSVAHSIRGSDMSRRSCGRPEQSASSTRVDASLPILARVPEAEEVDGRFLDLISHFVMAHEESADLTRLELFEFFADARAVQEAGRSGDQRSHGACGRGPVDGRQELMESSEVGQCFAGPLQLHQRGTGRG